MAIPLFRISFLCALGVGSLAAAEPDEPLAVAAAQRLFDAMAAHDGAAISNLLTPDARLIAVREDGKVSSSPGEQFAARIAGMKEPILERMWNPQVMLKGRVAQVWAEYDFYLAGKFGHCGVDVFTLMKTAEGWKIASVSYSVETAGCQPSPLGPPPPLEGK